LGRLLLRYDSSLLFLFPFHSHLRAAGRSRCCNSLATVTLRNLRSDCSDAHRVARFP
jgi:hypothetical protein